MKKFVLVVSGFFLSLLLLETGLWIGSYTIKFIQSQRNLRAFKKKGACRILCIGESTTQGQYPRFLEQELNRYDTGIRFSVIDAGRGGVSSTYLVDELPSNIEKYSPDMVLAMMGINEGGAVVPWENTTTTQIRAVYQKLRIYRLAKLLAMHMKEKAGKFGVIRRKKSEGKTVTNQNRIVALEKTESPDLISQGDWVEYIQSGRDRDKTVRALKVEEVLEKAVKLNPASASAYSELGRFYVCRDRFKEAEECFKRAVELDPEDANGYIERAWYYGNSGRMEEAEYYFKKAVELDPGFFEGYLALATIAAESGNIKLAEEYRKAGGWEKRYTALTRNNYRKLKELLDQKKIQLVCVQYPMRSVVPLKTLFRNEERSIIFIDNEKIFMDAVRAGFYKKYFKDMFAGDFGHCTDEGNRLLAKNIAKVVLEEYFKKPSLTKEKNNN